MKCVRFLWILLLSGVAFSQEKDPVLVTMRVVPEEVAPGGAGYARIEIAVDSAYHIGAGNPSLFGVAPEPAPGLLFGSIQLPEGEKEEYGRVLRGKIEIRVPFQVQSGAPAGIQAIRMKVTIQPCADNNEVCYPPQEKSVSAVFTVSGPGGHSGAQVQNESGIAERLSRALEKGSFLSFLLVFLGGILASLTPCVYPMIPITIAVIGAQASGNRIRGFILSLFYVLGISVTFTGLGIAAAKTGALFGSFAQHPVALGIVSAIFFIMGLSLLGVFVIQMPASMATRIRGKKKRSGFIGALFTGLLAGLVVSPCVSPLLVVILTWVARTGSLLLGAGLLFSFSLGLGVLFVLLGTFSGLIKTLPRSGGWMEAIEKGFGFLMIALALIFLRPVIPDFATHLAWSGYFIFFGTALGAFKPLLGTAGIKEKAIKAAGLFLILLGGCMMVFGFAQKYARVQPSGPAEPPAVSETRQWIESDTEGFSIAGALNKPVMIDFFAEWCAACHELDEKTWPDAGVQAAMTEWIAVKLDLTRTDERTRGYQKKYGIVGMPTVIFFDASGKERARFEGFKPPQEVLPYLSGTLLKTG